MTYLERLDEAIKRTSRSYESGYLKPGAGIQKVLAAARAYRDILADGQRVEWCETHNETYNGADDGLGECWAMETYLRGEPVEPCHLVSKLLSDYPKEAENG